MSSAMVKSHGGSKDIVSAQRGEGIVLGGIIKDTMAGVPKDVHMKSLDRLISKTTGVPRERPIMEGVLESTIPEHMKAVPELQKVHEHSKTVSKMASGVPYAGPKSGYGMAKHHSKKHHSKKHDEDSE